METGTGKQLEVVFEGECISLKAIDNAVPTLCPQSFGHGKLTDVPAKSFIVTGCLDTSGRFSSCKDSKGMALAPQNSSNITKLQHQFRKDMVNLSSDFQPQCNVATQRHTTGH